MAKLNLGIRGNQDQGSAFVTNSAITEKYCDFHGYNPTMSKSDSRSKELDLKAAIVNNTVNIIQVHGYGVTIWKQRKIQTTLGKVSMLP
jgi:hypothetical protein